MHSRMKENRARLHDDFKSSITDNRSRLDALPKSRISLNDSTNSRIVLPKIRDSSVSKFDTPVNTNSLLGLQKLGLPNVVQVNKSTQDVPTKNKYIKYKSLLRKSKVETERGYNPRDSRPRLPSSSSSHNMSVQEMMLDKVYGTIERDNKHYL